MRSIRQLLAGAAMLGTALCTHAAANLSDLWFDPAESRWGASIMQQGDTGFVILYLYGSDRSPAWYFASNAETYALSADGLPHMRGALYQSRGPWFGDVFDPGSVEVAPVGEVVIEPVSATKVRIHYRIGATSVSKEIVRLTWALPQPTSPFDARFSIVVRRDETPTREVFSALTTFELTPPRAKVVVRDAGSTCIYEGPYEQAGRLGSIAGAFECNDGRTGPFRITDLEFSTHGFAARIEASWGVTSMNGRMAGPRL